MNPVTSLLRREPRPPPPLAAQRPPTPPPERAEPAPRAFPAGFIERTAIFTAAFAPDRATHLLEQLVPAARNEAIELARRVAALEPAGRQGRVARTFGERSDSGERLRALMALAPPRLARALRERMPAHQRVLFPDVQPLARPGPGVSLAEALLAARLVKEATR